MGALGAHSLGLKVVVEEGTCRPVNDYLSLLAYFDSPIKKKCLLEDSPLGYNYADSAVGHCSVVHKLLTRTSVGRMYSLGFTIETQHSHSSC